MTWTPEQHEEMRKLEKALAKSDWAVGIAEDPPVLMADDGVMVARACDSMSNPAVAAEMRFIAVARTAVPAMLDEIERLQAAVTVLTTDIGSLRGDGP